MVSSRSPCLLHAHAPRHVSKKTTKRDKETKKQRNKETKKQRNKETKKQQPQKMEFIGELMLLLLVELIVVFSARDHGAYRGVDAAFACGADRGASVPQIKGSSWR